MSDAKPSPNEIKNHFINVNNSNGTMGRSVSSARFQIARVSHPDIIAAASIGKAISIPSGV
jgi:hypothetical protein